MTQKIFAVVTPREGVCSSDLAGAMQVEAAHAWSWHERGLVRELWSRTDAPGAVYVLESTPTAAADVLARQPLVRSGLVGYALAPVSAFLCLVDLFGSQQHVVEPASAEPRRGTGRVLALDRLGDGVTRADLDTHMFDEARQTWALLKAGLVREAHRRTDRPGAVLVLEAAGVGDAASIVGRLPLVRAGLATYDLMAVGAFTGLDVLMDGGL